MLDIFGCPMLQLMLAAILSLPPIAGDLKARTMAPLAPVRDPRMMITPCCRVMEHEVPACSSSIPLPSEIRLAVARTDDRLSQVPPVCQLHRGQAAPVLVQPD